MSRSIWKGPFSQLRSKLLDIKHKHKKEARVWSRTSMIVPSQIGKEYKVHNGKDWIPVKVVEDMVGHRFGEFSSTKGKTVHKLNKRKQSTRKK
jgi:small subunit ribosomal protein S19